MFAWLAVNSFVGVHLHRYKIYFSQESMLRPRKVGKV